MAFKILHSTTKLLPAWDAYLKEFKFAIHRMPRDVSTRWNSTFDMLDFALSYRKVIDAVSADREMELRQFELSELEWKIVGQLRDVLKVSRSDWFGLTSQGFSSPRWMHNIRSTLLSLCSLMLVWQVLKDATIFFSRSTSNLATVIPAMDVIDKKLTTDSLRRSSYDAPIHASLGLAKKTLNRYYSMTDWSEAYKIAMGTFTAVFLILLLLLILLLVQFSTQDTSSHTSRR